MEKALSSISGIKLNMTKKNDLPETPDYLPNSTPENTAYITPSPALQALVASDIVTVVDGAIIWRSGHLEHLARQYAVDPVGTWRLYADDMEIIRQYSDELFNKLVNEALHE
jgi:hypothetical protein